ncbi:hypothetical protein [Pontixanthobacter aquaemixtae]|uniref:Uncharacterized protein n=1 Tax=Pontixanthobacter aquaemixtae TaxID=1958940 RepID=A0A844ZXM2_9SPHN|nr:hypothetical protein [Pontixanthobacter aquaemixtae]MXO91982.1 hypothetical protein [Pontixanthobacter aquaemixtae]
MTASQPPVAKSEITRRIAADEATRTGRKDHIDVVKSGKLLLDFPIPANKTAITHIIM